MSDSFEEKVLQGLKQCKLNLEESQNAVNIGVAVSGGADSVSLLLALANISKKFPLNIKVITVNHFIRPDEETCADIVFVKDLCGNLEKNGFNVSCKVVELEKGSVHSLCRENKLGMEGAARVLRYKAFESFIKENELEGLCLAHNQNDQLETLIMRFLQGSGIDHSGGIQFKRDKYLRPLLNISRSEIEAYLKERNQPYCTDSTNADTKYFRNNIRNNLIPVLEKNFPGWKNGVLNGAVKAQEDAIIIENRVQEYYKNHPLSENKEQIEIDINDFLKWKKGVQNRVLLDCMNLVSKNNGEERFPFVFVEEILDLLQTSKNDFSKRINQLEIGKKKNVLFVKMCTNMNTDLVFSVIIQEDGFFNLPFGQLEISSLDNLKKKICINGTATECYFSYPVCVRNVEPDDYVLSASDSLKKVTSIFSDWKVGTEYRDLIPVVQQLSGSEQSIICILGKALGFKDWVLRK